MLGKKAHSQGLLCGITSQDITIILECIMPLAESANIRAS